ncbi:hypothetical protein [Mariluticola halotolerans]|uniref:hypothetical protein n=1 Tax=Mariluticola halotolerans TaxID=2909283 RepID=UPI0026E2D466|nr:hypothetical protein [Mariluticola halotolerans]UJQ94513.1 hypothetical protein L1P08_00520 [Mariluticola halotolerans]
MAKKPTARVEMVMYDVVYEDGSQRSNRRVPADLLQGLDGGEDAVKAEIERQDLEISEKSGIPPLAIKTVKRSGK